MFSYKFHLFFLAYTNKTLMEGGGRNHVPCNFTSVAGYGQVCSVNVEQSFGPCSELNGFGYEKSAPCIILKLNKVRFRVSYFLMDFEQLDLIRLLFRYTIGNRNTMITLMNCQKKCQMTLRKLLNYFQQMR